MFIEQSNFRSNERETITSLRARQPAVFATRLVREPTIVSVKNFDALRAAHYHEKTPTCVTLRCERCEDLATIERNLASGELELQPISPPLPVLSKERK